MELTPVKFLFLFLFLAALGYIVFTSAARLVAWVVSRTIGGRVRFRVAGLNGLKEIYVDLHKGPVASLSISELKVSIRKPSGRTGWKFHLVASEIDVALREQKRGKKKNPKRGSKHTSPGRGSWMVLTNLASYVNISLNELTLKLPENISLVLDIKELDLESFRDEASVFTLGVKLFLAPCLLYVGDEKKMSLAQRLYPEHGGEFVVFSLERFSLTSSLDHDREAGVFLKQMQAECGAAVLNLNSDVFPAAAAAGDEAPDHGGGAEIVAETVQDEVQPEVAARVLARKVPELIEFSLPKFELNFYCGTEISSVKNNVKSFFLRGNRSRPLEGSVDVISVLDIQMDFGEINVCEELFHSVIDVLKVSVSISLEFPAQLPRPLRAEVDVKFGGTRFNLHMNKLGDLMALAALRPAKKRKKSSKPRAYSLSWSCGISAPDMAIVVYNLDGLPFVHVSSQSSHLYVNVAPKRRAVVHAELGEFYVSLLEAGLFCTELLLGPENCAGSLVHVGRLSVDSGVEAETSGETPTLSVEAGAIEFYLGWRNLKAAIVASVSAEACVKRFTGNKVVVSKGKSRGEAGGLIKLHFQQLVFRFDEDLHVEEITVPDPKKVNFGSQGGIVMITKQDTGVRTAKIEPVGCAPGARKKFSFSLLQITVNVDRSKKTSLLEIENCRMLYEESCLEINSETLVLELQNLKLVHRPAKLEDEVLMHLVLSASNARAHWDPDVHLFFYELSLRLKELLSLHRGRNGQKASSPPRAAAGSKLVYALDIESLNLSAELADGVQGNVFIQSVFSEDAAIGLLLENIDASLNKASVFRSERLQVSRLPSSATQEQVRPGSRVWDVIIQGAGVRIIMPYRLPLRAIEDAVEDMWRGLKLSMTALKTGITRRNKAPELAKPTSSTSSFRVHFIKLLVRGISAEIEEEPFQGWLDEHYHLLRQQSRVLLVRERLLEEANLKGKKLEIWEQLQEQTFQAYKKACARLTPGRGSGACSSGFQAGFKPSSKRVSLMSITAESLEVTLTDIRGGRSGMIELIRKLDCVSPELEVPFGRIYGRHVVAAMSSLAISLRDYSLPMLSASNLSCDGSVVFAQQATCFQKQMLQRVFIGRWRRVEMFRSMSGLTPSYKFYSQLPIQLSSGKVSFGVGFEPAFADVSYAFTVALRKQNLSLREPGPLVPPVKKEKSLPWWDDMRYYVHGVNSINVVGFEWSFLATADPYEVHNRMHMVSKSMLISQAEGRLSFLGSDFDMFISSLDPSSASSGSESPRQFIHAPVFQLDISMEWSCASGEPRNHYLHAFPSEMQARPLVYDPFRSIAFSLVWSFTLRTNTFESETGGSCESLNEIPFMNLCAQDLIWIFKWWSLYFSPPHKLRSFSRCPRFGVERIARSGNLSLDKVLTEFILRVDSTPTSIRHSSLTKNDPAEGLTFNMQRLRYELCYSRGLQEYTFECKRELLDPVYQGLDVHSLRTKLSDGEKPENHHVGDMSGKRKQAEKPREDGFLLSTDCFTIRKQSPKADTTRLSSWRENVQVRGSGGREGEESDPEDDPSDDDGFNVVLADNCLRVSLYGLKLFWTVPNRDAVWAWAGDISKAFEAPKPSPSRQYAQRKLMEEKQKASVVDEQGVVLKAVSSGASQEHIPPEVNGGAEEEGNLQFMVNVVQPQFNLHSEDAHGRFLLAAASGRVLARSFHSIFYVGFEVIEQALGAGVFPIHGSLPQLSWKRRELSVLLEHVQAHVAPTDVDPGAGIQWLPQIPKGALKVKRTGALLERVFLPCSMYFQYIRHKGGTTDCKVKPLKELSFNSPNIAATMTSRQFHIMVDVLSNLLFSTLPKPRKGEEEEEIEEATDEVVPEGVEEVELARIKLEQAERDVKLAFDDLAIVKQRFRFADGIRSPDQSSSGESPEGSLNNVLSKMSTLVRTLEIDLILKRKTRKTAYASVRFALQREAQQRLMEKEKSKSPSAAMRISWAINKVVWSMLADGQTFAEAEISSMILNVDRDFSDMGAARFNVKSFVVKNCLRQAKSNTVLSAWNAPAEWGRNVMLRVDARQGAPIDGVSLLELFQVEIYPLKIHLTEAMYTMMWEYFFPGDEQDPQKRQNDWKGSTTSVSKRNRKGASSSGEPSRTSAPGTPPTLHGVPVNHHRNDVSMASQALTNSKPRQKNLEHYRSRSFDKNLEENEASSQLASLVRSSTHGSDELLSALSTPSLLAEAEPSKSKDNRKTRSSKASQEKETKNRKIFLEIHNIKISQVELLVTYEGSKFSVSELRLLMDTFTRSEFTGSWRRLFSRVKKHIIWGVLKSVTGMQGKKFKDKQGTAPFPDSDSNSSDTIASPSRSRLRFPIPHFQKHADRAGEGFVSSIRGLFNSQRRKTRALVRTMRGGSSEAHSELAHSDGGDSRSALRKSKLLRRQSRKLQQQQQQQQHRPSISKGAILLGDRYCSSPRASPPYHTDAESSSSGSSTYEDFDM